MPEDPVLQTLSRQLVERLTAAGRTLATAESCTGGWIAKAVTDIAGSSACFGYGIVSYSNAAKESVLGVGGEVLLGSGAVSEEVVREMAQGVLKLSGADIALAVSGVAGPDGGTAEKPVGTVWFAWSDRAGTSTERQQFAGDREAVREQTVLHGLRGVMERLPA